VRETHFAILSPKYFAPYSPILLLLRFRFKEERVTHFEIPSPKYFAIFSLLLPQTLEKVIESIYSLGVYCSFSISYYKFYVFIDILSTIDS